MDNAADAGQTVANKKTKKDKVRSAWISFAGRIVAQLVGAIATVALGVMMLHRYTATDARPSAPDVTQANRAVPAAPHTSAQPVVHVIVLTPAMVGLRDGDQRFWAADRACAPRLDGTPTAAAHLDDRTVLSR